MDEEQKAAMRAALEHAMSSVERTPAVAPWLALALLHPEPGPFVEIATDVQSREAGVVDEDEQSGIDYQNGIRHLLAWVANEASSMLEI